MVDYISEPSQGPESCRGAVSPKEKMSLYQIKKPNMNKSRAHSIYSKQNLDNSEVVKVKPCVLLRHVRKTTIKEEKMLSMKASII